MKRKGRALEFAFEPQKLITGVSHMNPLLCSTIFNPAWDSAWQIAVHLGANSKRQDRTVYKVNEAEVETNPAEPLSTASCTGSKRAA